MSMSAVHSTPDLWPLEIRIIQITAERQDIPLETIRPDSRLVEDLHIDSLDMVELLVALEEQFGVSIPDDIGKQMFIRSPLTITALAEIVRHQWGTGTPTRQHWISQKQEIPATDTLPFTQFDGVHSPSREPLLSRLAATSGGWEQFRRRTDGMRCVLIPGDAVELGTGVADDAGDEAPRHRVHIRSFVMDAEPVSLTRPTGIRSERGGSWVGPGELARSSYRRGRPPEAVGRCLGFRCARSAEDLPQ